MIVNYRNHSTPAAYFINRVIITARHRVTWSNFTQILPRFKSNPPVLSIILTPLTPV